MRKIVFIVLVLLSLNAKVFAQDVFQSPKSAQEIVQNLPEFKNINCAFKEIKNVENSPKSIESGGRFKFMKNENVIFQTTYPIRSSYMRGQNKEISDIISAISNKNSVYLEKNFDTFFIKNKNSWTIGLKPKKVSSFDNLTLQGNDYIKKVVADSSSIGKTTVFFYCGK